MTRIRFEGFSRLRVLSAQGAPPAWSGYITRRE